MTRRQLLASLLAVPAAALGARLVPTSPWAIGRLDRVYGAGDVYGYAAGWDRAQGQDQTAIVLTDTDGSILFSGRITDVQQGDGANWEHVWRTRVEAKSLNHKQFGEGT